MFFLSLLCLTSPATQTPGNVSAWFIRWIKQIAETHSRFAAIHTQVAAFTTFIANGFEQNLKTGAVFMVNDTHTRRRRRIHTCHRQQTTDASYGNSRTLHSNARLDELFGYLRRCLSIWPHGIYKSCANFNDILWRDPLCYTDQVRHIQFCIRRIRIRDICGRFKLD